MGEWLIAMGVAVVTYVLGVRVGVRAGVAAYRREFAKALLAGRSPAARAMYEAAKLSAEIDR